MAIDPDRQKALEAAVTSIERQYGKGSIMRLGAAEHLRHGHVHEVHERRVPHCGA